MQLSLTRHGKDQLMKSNRRRPARQAPRPNQEIAASTPGTSGLDMNAYVIRASHTRHGPRTAWGPIQWAQAAIAEIYPSGIPRAPNKSKLVRAVNVRLDRDPEYRATRHGYLTRSTILRALDRM
jgi:hypothetical protein